MFEVDFILLVSSALYRTKRERWKLRLAFDFSWNVQFSLWRARWSFAIRWCAHRMCMQFCVFPPVSAFEHSDAVPPRGTLLVSGSLHTVTQTEQTPAPVPRFVLINYQQRLYPAAVGGKQCIKRNGREVGMRFYHHWGSVWRQGNQSSPIWYDLLRTCRYISFIVWPLFFFLV